MRVIGLGFRPNATKAALIEAIELIADGNPPDALAVLAERADNPELTAAAGFFNARIVAIPRERLAGIATPTQSPRIQAMFGVGSLAEALALAALGPGARLLRPRALSSDRHASAALAEGDAA